MNPPFWGTKTIDSVSLDDVMQFVDRETLFAARWQFRQGAGAGDWEKLKRERAEPALERILSICRASGAIEPKILYGYFRCKRDGNALFVDGENRSFRIDFPRDRAAPNRCVADFFPEGFAAVQAVTVGDGPAREGARLFSANAYSDAFFLKGLAAEAAEATAEFAFRRILEELGAPGGSGMRFSPGYPSFPDLFAQKKIAALLGITRIGVSVTRTSGLVPEHSTTAIVSVDPGASRFRP